MHVCCTFAAGSHHVYITFSEFSINAVFISAHHHLCFNYDLNMNQELLLQHVLLQGHQCLLDAQSFLPRPLFESFGGIILVFIRSGRTQWERIKCVISAWCDLNGCKSALDVLDAVRTWQGRSKDVEWTFSVLTRFRCVHRFFSERSAVFMVFVWVWWHLKAQWFVMRTVKTLIRLGGCSSWSESSLGARVILLFFRCEGSNRNTRNSNNHYSCGEPGKQFFPSNLLTKLTSNKSTQMS